MDDLRQPIPLHMIIQDECVELVCIKSCGRVHRRLQELGLTTGASLRVITRHPSGLIILAVRGDSRMAIDKSIAQNIMVRRG